MDNTKLWEWLRAKITHEDAWIQQRVNWLLASNAFLFAAIAAISATGRQPHSAMSPLLPLLSTLIPLVGLALAILVYVGLRGAADAISNAEQEWNRLRAAERKSVHYPALHSPEGAKSLGRAASQGIAIVIALAWAILLLGAICQTIRYIPRW